MGRLHSAHTNLSCVPPADPDGRDHSSAGGSCGTGVRTYRVRIAFSRSALSVPGLAPRKGRDEDDGFQLWIRRHDEYDSQRRAWRRFMTNSAPDEDSDYNAKIIKEFRAGQGRVGGPWANGVKLVLRRCKLMSLGPGRAPR